MALTIDGIALATKATKSPMAANIILFLAALTLAGSPAANIKPNAPITVKPTAKTTKKRNAQLIMTFKVFKAQTSPHFSLVTVEEQLVISQEAPDPIHVPGLKVSPASTALDPILQHSTGAEEAAEAIIGTTKLAKSAKKRIFFILYSIKINGYPNPTILKIYAKNLIDLFTN